MADESTDPVLSQPTRFQADRANRSPHIHVLDITLEYHGHRLLEGADLHMISGRVYGLIAANGAGKTSLLRSIADRRLMNFPHYLSVGYVEQETDAIECTALEFALQVIHERTKLLEQQEDELLARSDIDSDDVQQQLQEIYEELDELETRGEQSAVDALRSAGFTKARMHLPMAELSGGWRKKAALARVFVHEPDVLLLDEPTNHLDMRSIEWLANMIEAYLSPDRSVLVVSHDVNFMNRVCTDTAVLNDLRLTYHPAKYEDFLLYLDVEKKRHQHQYEQQETKRKHMLETIDKIKSHARTHRKSERTMNAGMIASRQKRMYHLGQTKTAQGTRYKLSYMDKRPVIQATRLPKRVHLIVPTIPDPLLKENAIVLSNVTLRVGDKDILQQVDYAISKSARIGLLGPNGSGKSSLLRLLSGELTPDAGDVRVAHGARIAYFHQHPVDTLPLELTAVQYVCSSHQIDSEDVARTHLATVGITGATALRPMKALSGGEKARVALANILYTRPHILLLDEVTDHLDLRTVGL
mmetsp:Transcript_38457/g.96740  ORF Transcript_38457/g.96740 Transcript_38457/m.96740 type:complete len:528 (-) Transcript_38457:222-1805(-)